MKNCVINQNIFFWLHIKMFWLNIHQSFTDKREMSIKISKITLKNILRSFYFCNMRENFLMQGWWYWFLLQTINLSRHCFLAEAHFVWRWRRKWMALDVLCHNRIHLFDHQIDFWHQEIFAIKFAQNLTFGWLYMLKKTFLRL